MNDPIETLDIARVVRNRLTAIALCADSLQVAFKANLSAPQEEQFAVIHSSIKDVKLILDRMAVCFQAELLALRQRQLGSELIGTTSATTKHDALLPQTRFDLSAYSQGSKT